MFFSFLASDNKEKILSNASYENVKFTRNFILMSARSTPRSCLDTLRKLVHLVKETKLRVPNFVTVLSELWSRNLYKEKAVWKLFSMMDLYC